MAKDSSINWWILSGVLVLIGGAIFYGFKNQDVKEPVKIIETVEPVKEEITYKLSWEKYPENRPWTIFVNNLISTEAISVFNTAQDIKEFCPKYFGLDMGDRVHVWAEMISAISYYESAWKPGTKFDEPKLGYPSLGLMQLSYEDLPNHPYCKFEKGNPDKSILDPYLNLDCGIRILKTQISRKGKIVIRSGAYWSVIKEGHKNNKVPLIKKMVLATGLCG